MGNKEKEGLPLFFLLKKRTKNMKIVVDSLDKLTAALDELKVVDVQSSDCSDPCARCANNPKNNPFASGVCSCALPYMIGPNKFTGGTQIASDRWIYNTTTTTATPYTVGNSWVYHGSSLPTYLDSTEICINQEAS